MVRFVDAMTSGELVMIDIVQTLADMVRGFYDLAHLRFGKAAGDFGHAYGDAGSIGGDMTPGGALALTLGGLGALLGAKTVWGLGRGVMRIGGNLVGGAIEGMGGEALGAAAAGGGVTAGGLGIAGGVALLNSWGTAWLGQWLAKKTLGAFGYDENGNVKPALASSVAWAESGGHQIDPKTGRTVRSRAGALGIMQLMPGTAKALGVDPYDPAQNLAGGMKLLSMLMQKYGNVQEVLAAYNWGEPSLDAALRRHGGRFALDYLPRETQDYIRRIEGHMGQVTINAPITVHSPNATPEQIRSATRDGIDEALRNQNRRQLINAQAQGVW